MLQSREKIPKLGGGGGPQLFTFSRFFGGDVPNRDDKCSCGLCNSKFFGPHKWWSREAGNQQQNGRLARWRHQAALNRCNSILIWRKDITLLGFHTFPEVMMSQSEWTDSVDFTDVTDVNISPWWILANLFLWFYDHFEAICRCLMTFPPLAALLLHLLQCPPPLSGNARILGTYGPQTHPNSPLIVHLASGV